MERLERSGTELFWGTEMFYVVVIVTVTWVYTFVRSQQTIHLEWVDLLYANYISAECAKGHMAGSNIFSVTSA